MVQEHLSTISSAYALKNKEMKLIKTKRKIAPSMTNLGFHIVTFYKQ